jgi:hypothetical protein
MAAVAADGSRPMNQISVAFSTACTALFLFERPVRLPASVTGMNTKLERSFRGEFSARDLGSGAWLLTGTEQGGAEIYLIGIEPEAARLLAQARATRAALHWGEDGVVVTLVTATGAKQVKPRAATVHEPLPRLYGSLPLERLDERAGRFWRRVFFLVRVPGGRRLLGLIARRASAPK